MGSGIIIKCNKCEFSKELLLGYGMYKPTFEKTMETIDERNINVVERLLENYCVEDFHVTRQIYYCEECSEIVDKSALKIDFQDGVKFGEQMYCNKCNNKMGKINNLKEIDNIHCPNCREAALTYIENYISWD